MRMYNEEIEAYNMKLCNVISRPQKSISTVIHYFFPINPAYGKQNIKINACWIYQYFYYVSPPAPKEETSCLDQKRLITP